MQVLREFKRRNVFRVGAAYLAGAWILIQLANNIFPLFGLSYSVGRLVVIILAIGFVPALLIAWAFELSPKQSKTDSGADDAERIARKSITRFDRGIAVVLALAVALFAVDRFVLRQAQWTDAPVLNGFAQELAANRTAVDGKLFVHEAFLGVLREPSIEQPLAFPDTWRLLIGRFKPPPLAQSEWDAAQITGALQGTDSRLVKALSVAYSTQDRYVTSVNTSFLDLASWDLTKDGKNAILTYLYGSISQEHDLLDAYQDALDLLAKTGIEVKPLPAHPEVPKLTGHDVTGAAGPGTLTLKNLPSDLGIQPDKR